MRTTLLSISLSLVIISCRNASTQASANTIADTAKPVLKKLLNDSAKRVQAQPNVVEYDSLPEQIF